MGVLHLDPFSGLAGDMFLGACLDAGLPLAVLEELPGRLRLDGVTVEARRARRGGIAGVRFRVLRGGVPIEGPDPEEVVGNTGLPAGAGRTSGGAGAPEGRPGEGVHGRHLGEILALLRDGDLEAPVRERAEALFRRLGEAEAAVHGVEVEAVHFHEVGAVDAIVDLVGAAAAVEHLAPERITCGPVRVGTGSVETAHGRLPVPAPATARLLAGAVVAGGGEGELLTPTGAVLIRELVDEHVALPEMVVEGVGYGLGRREIPGAPNAFRLWCGAAAEARGGEVVVLEAAVDDLSGEGLGHAAERLLEEGALDVWLAPVTMKRGRPGSLVTVLCRPSRVERLGALLLAETGSLGCRVGRAQRLEARRWSETVETPFGPVRVKRGRFAGRAVADAPEYADCAEAARRHGVSWREVHRAALAADRGAGTEARPDDGERRSVGAEAEEDGEG